MRPVVAEAQVRVQVAEEIRTESRILPVLNRLPTRQISATTSVLRKLAQAALRWNSDSGAECAQASSV